MSGHNCPRRWNHARMRATFGLLATIPALSTGCANDKGAPTEVIAFGIEMGAVAKVVGQSVGGVSGRTGALDLGLSRAMRRYTAALTVQNMGPNQFCSNMRNSHFQR